VKKKLPLIVATSALALTLVGCGVAEDSDKEVKEEVKTEEVVVEKETENVEVDETVDAEQAVLDAVELNLQYAETENLDGYMDTLDIPEESVELVRQSTQQLFDAFDLDYEIVSAEVLELNEDSAIVEVVQKTIATDVAEGQLFNNNEALATHTLNLVDGKWKIATTNLDPTSVKMLDKNGDPVF